MNRSLALNPYFSKIGNTREALGFPLVILSGSWSDLSICHSFCQGTELKVFCVAFVFSRNTCELAGGLQAMGAGPKRDFLVLIDGGLLSCEQEWTAVQS